MELTEEKIFSAFGIDPQREEGANDPDPAEPEKTNTEEDTEEQQPEEIEAETGDAGQEDDQPEPAPPEAGQTEQTPEERRANAARRREAEKQQAIQTAVQQALQQRDQETEAAMKTFFAKAGLTNPFTKEPITNMEEFDAWDKAREDARIQQELKNGKLTEETLQALIERNPAVQQAREAAEQRRQEEEAAQARAFEQSVQAQLAEIRKSDPSIKELGDLMKRPYSAEFYAAVKRGNNFLDAFYLATRSQAIEQAASAARQQAISNRESKNHLHRTGMGNKPGAPITAA